MHFAFSISAEKNRFNVSHIYRYLLIAQLNRLATHCFGCSVCHYILNANSCLNFKFLIQIRFYTALHMIMKINYPIISVLFAYPLINCPLVFFYCLKVHCCSINIHQKNNVHNISYKIASSARSKLRAS